MVTLQAAARLHAGLLAFFLYGDRRHLAILLRLAPTHVYVATLLVKQNSCSWKSAWYALLLDYIDVITKLGWEPRGEWEEGLGNSYSRFSVSQKKPYTGYDEKTRYDSSGWASFAERNWRHDVDTYKELDHHHCEE